MIPKLGGRINRIYNRLIVYLVNIYSSHVIYIFIECSTIEVQHFINVTMKLTYTQYIIKRYNVYSHNNI